MLLVNKLMAKWVGRKLMYNSKYIVHDTYSRGLKTDKNQQASPGVTHMVAKPNRKPLSDLWVLAGKIPLYWLLYGYYSYDIYISCIHTYIYTDHIYIYIYINVHHIYIYISYKYIYIYRLRN